MTLIVGRGRARYTEMIVNRTSQSGGSLGGNKKSGTVYYGPSWPQSSISLTRANTNSTFDVLITTTNPVQRRRSTFSLVSGII